MLFSPDPRATKPPTGRSDGPTTATRLPRVPQTGQLNTPTTSVKLPTVIPGTTKRKPTAPLHNHARKRSRFVLPGTLVGCVLVLTLAALFVIPLDNSQHPQTIAQAIGQLFSSGQPAVLNTSEHAATPPASLNANGCRGTDIWSTCATYIADSGIMGTGHMQRPIVGAVITQIFGHMEYQLWCGCWKPHTGIDLAAPYGTPIMAADTGQVIWVGWDWSGLGWAIKINHGNYIATIYGHMDHYIVKVGQNVTRGQIIGYEGSTGASTGPHLHFMVLVNNMWVNPMNYVQLP